MKRAHAGLLAVALTFLFLDRTTGSPSDARQDNPTSPSSSSGVRDADQFPGADLGARINAAVASLGPEGGVVRIHRGAYTWKTAVIIDPRKISLQGDGSAFVLISCEAAKCLELTEPQYSITQGGSVGGFTLSGNATSDQTGILAGGVIGETYADIVATNFSGSGSAALQFNNSAATYGWMERTTARKLRFDNNFKGLELKYNSHNPSAASFGYSDLELECDDVRSEQTCLAVTSGRLYHSRLLIFGNVGSGGTLIALPGAKSGDDQLFSNTYQIFAEGSGTGLSVGRGALFSGYGTVDFGSMPVKNANPPSFSSTFRVLQGPTEVVNGDGGSLKDFLGTGNPATIHPVLVRDIGTPVAGFGFLEGKNISSAYVALYGGGSNAFAVLACPYSPSNLGDCSAVTTLDASGNIRATGTVYTHGADYAESVRVSGTVSQYAPGDVLAIDPGSEAHFQLSDAPYSTRVAGIYSTEPGVLGGATLTARSSPKEIPLAIHGVVPCKVSAENGPIVPGDLLVSAATPGHAMKGTDRNRMTGAVIGKSLGNLPGGTGTIAVLVALQ